MATTVGKIGQIAIDYIARTKNFTKGSKRVNEALERTRRGAKGAQAAAQRMGRMLTNVGIGLAAGGVIAALRQTANEIDRLAKTSDKLGITTEALGGLQHAAELNGIAANQLAVGLQRMTRRVAEAARGTGVLVKPLERLGLSAKQLIELSPDKQFEKISQALGGITNQSEKIATAFAFFDTEGVDLIRLAGQHLGKYREEAERLGALVSREEAKKVEEFNDSLARVGKQLKGVKQRIVIDIAPAVTETLIFLRKLQEDAQRLLKAVGIGGRVDELLDISGTKKVLRGAAEFLNVLNFEGKPVSRALDNRQEDSRQEERVRVFHEFQRREARARARRSFVLGEEARFAAEVRRDEAVRARMRAREEMLNEARRRQQFRVSGLRHEERRLENILLQTGELNRQQLQALNRIQHALEFEESVAIPQ